MRVAVRLASGRNAQPSAAVLDSRSVKTSERGGVRGYDGGKKINGRKHRWSAFAPRDCPGYDCGKKINGRKHHILVDTMGLLLRVLVTPANVTDREGGVDLLTRAKGFLPTLRHLFVDSGYQGEWAASSA